MSIGIARCLLSLLAVYHFLYVIEITAHTTWACVKGLQNMLSEMCYSDQMPNFRVCVKANAFERVKDLKVWLAGRF